MKRSIGAALAMALFVSSAAAQTADQTADQTAPAAANAPIAAPSRCPAIPAAAMPPVPDGATASPAQIQAADVAVLSWNDTLFTALQCRKAEHDDLVATLTARRQEFDAAKARLDQGVATWTAERNEYCARPRASCVAN